jgi:uncharacterized protein YutD/predicted protein tyrosine phosphatase
MDIERFDLSIAEISSNEFFECVFNFKDKISHLYATMSDIGNASVRAIINVVEPIEGDFIHTMRSDEPYLRDEAFWCMGLYITDVSWSSQGEWLAMVFQSLKYAGEKDEHRCFQIGNIEYNYIWPVAKETAKIFLKAPKDQKDHDKLYERNCEIMITVAQAAWKGALTQDATVVDALQKAHDEEIQKISKCLMKSKKILAIDLIDSCLSSVQELFNFIPEQSVDVFKAYYIYGAWEILEVIINMIRVAQNTVNNFRKDMKSYKMNDRISEVYSNIQYFIKSFNLSNIFMNENVDLACTGLISNLTNIILDYCDLNYVSRQVFISRLLESL